MHLHPAPWGVRWGPADSGAHWLCDLQQLMSPEPQFLPERGKGNAQVPQPKTGAHMNQG